MCQILSTMKTCSKCSMDKPLTEFSRHIRRRDGLQTHCKECQKAVDSAWRSANRDRKKATDLAWRAANLEKARAKTSKWVAANPEKKRATNIAWAIANPDKVSAARAAWRAENPEKCKELAHKWRAANPDAGRINSHNRRARKRANGGRLSHDIAEHLFKLQRGKCACGCKQSLGDDYHLDHIMPLALGGPNADDNIQLLRSTCNQKKSTKHPVDFMQSKGYLL